MRGHHRNKIRRFAIHVDGNGGHALAGRVVLVGDHRQRHGTEEITKEATPGITLPVATRSILQIPGSVVHSFVMC